MQADGAARSEFDRAARSPAPRAPAISAPPPTLPSKTATLTQLSCALTGSARGDIGPLIKRWFKNPIRKNPVRWPRQHHGARSRDSLTRESERWSVSSQGVSTREEFGA